MNIANFCGINIIENKHFPMRKPKMVLSKDVAVSDAFRESFNAWLKDFFGEQSYMIMMDTSLIGVSKNTIVGDTMTFDKLMAAVMKANG
jgi:hypothetical protein